MPGCNASLKEMSRLERREVGRWICSVVLVADLPATTTDCGGALKISAYARSFRVPRKTHVNDAMIWFLFDYNAPLICSSSSLCGYVGDGDLAERSGKEGTNFVL